MEKNNKNQKLVLRKDQEGEQVLTRLTKKKMREHSSYKSLEWKRRHHYRPYRDQKDNNGILPTTVYQQTR